MPLMGAIPRCVSAEAALEENQNCSLHFPTLELLIADQSLYVCQTGETRDVSGCRVHGPRQHKATCTPKRAALALSPVSKTISCTPTPISKVCQHSARKCPLPLRYQCISSLYNVPHIRKRRTTEVWVACLCRSSPRRRSCTGTRASSLRSPVGPQALLRTHVGWGCSRAAWHGAQCGSQSRSAVPGALQIDNRELLVGDCLAIISFCLYKQVHGRSS